MNINKTKLTPGSALSDLIGELEQGSITPILWADLKALRDNSALTPGAWYRITDYVTTVNGLTNSNARSAGHAFDIIVTATSTDVLSEEAWAIPHNGDTYFKDSRLEAWQLKYRLDNVQWSQQAGTYVTNEDNGYTFLVLGDITLQGHTYKLLQGFGMYIEDWSDYALMDTVEEGEPIYCYYGDPEDFDPDEPEEVGTASSVDVVTEDGKGTITWMKDEFGNECPYDFKNIQFKHYLCTDSVSGRKGLDGKYMVADPNNCPLGLSVEDTEDFIWAYTFSSDNAGGEQTDYSLTAEHQVHDNVMKANGSELNNITFFGNQNYGTSFGNNCSSMSFGNQNYGMSFGNDCYSMSFGNNCYRMSFGNNCGNLSFGNDCYSMSFGNSCYYMSFGNSCYYMSFGNNCSSMSFGNNCYRMSFGNSCYRMSFGNDCRNGTITEGVQYVDIPTNTWNFQLLNGLAGTNSSHLTPSFATQKAYTQVACKNSSGQLKIYVPSELICHNIAINGDSTTRIYTTLVTSFSTAFDVDSFIAYINNLSSPAGIMCTGTVRTNSSGIATGRTAARIVPGNASGNIGIAYHDTGDAGIAGPIYYTKGSGAN
jgi:hypothetical protein